jgi:hypothetical protein
MIQFCIRLLFFVFCYSSSFAEERITSIEINSTKIAKDVFHEVILEVPCSWTKKSIFYNYILYARYVDGARVSINGNQDDLISCVLLNFLGYHELPEKQVMIVMRELDKAGQWVGACVFLDGDSKIARKISVKIPDKANRTTIDKANSKIVIKYYHDNQYLESDELK